MAKARNILILGGGFGGLKAASTLAKKLKKSSLDKKYKVVLVDKNPYHIFTPLLYEAATTSKDSATQRQLQSLITFNLKEIFNNEEISIIKDEVIDIDFKKHSVTLKNKKILFEYLVIALGSEVNFFNIAGLKKYSLSLKTFHDAIDIRNTILEQLQSNSHLNVVVGGGGPTGVELSSELREWSAEISKENKKRDVLDVTLIEGQNKILPGFEHGVIKRVKKRLGKIGVHIITGERIEKVNKKIIHLQSKKLIPYDILVWAGGTKAISLDKKTLLRTNGGGRIKIADSTGCISTETNLKTYDKIYAIGDIACSHHPKTKKPHPPVARSAIEQGKIAAKNIFEDIKKQQDPTNKVRHYLYQHREYPYILPVGGKYAVAKIGPIILSGKMGWIFKGVVELYYFLSIMPLWQSIKIWCLGLWIFIKNDRLG